MVYRSFYRLKHAGARWLSQITRTVSRKTHTSADAYQNQLDAENQKWGEHLKLEASQTLNAWLDHPLILAHYRERSLVDGLTWQQWVVRHLGARAQKSMELGCGSGSQSIFLWETGASSYVEGIDISKARVEEGEKQRSLAGAVGQFRVSDVNTLTLPANTFDLIFSCHSFHHFLKLEHIMSQISEALTPGGVFVLEEYVGPTQFQWTDLQMQETKRLLRTLPSSLRKGRFGFTKTFEGRPSRDQVIVNSPFESIRSAEILPLFEKQFDVLATRKLGGTIQHLLYNGIMGNFQPGNAEIDKHIRSIYEEEDRLIDSGHLPSDFMLLMGKKRR